MYEFVCKNGNKILSEVELPIWERGRNKGKINREAMVGMSLVLEYKQTYKKIKILNVLKENRHWEFRIIIFDYKLYINIRCDTFIQGCWGGILNLNPNNLIDGNFIYNCNENAKILNELPYSKSRVDCKQMTGMVLNLEYNKIIYTIKIVEYIRDENNAKFIIERDDNTKYEMLVGNFMRGYWSNLLDRYVDLNNKYIDDEGIVHIHIINTKGEEFEALYSGNHVEEVMKCNWCIENYNGLHVMSSNVFNKRRLRLHRIDFNLKKWEVVDHINNNPLDNRIENLRIVTKFENNKNKNTNNKLGLTGIRGSGKGWLSSFTYKGYRISTTTKYDLNEAKLDNLIAQKHLGYKHNEELFYMLNVLPEERIKEVTDLLDKKIERNKNKILEQKEYKHDIEEKDNYYILHKNGKEMLFDCDLDILKHMNVYESNRYWVCTFIENNKKKQSRFHRKLLNISPNEYNEYCIQIDHLNNDPNDNRYKNLIIVTMYSNLCNKRGKGYHKRKSYLYQVTYMDNYKFWDLIGVTKQASFKTEQEAIDEVNRRRDIVENARVKLKDKEELEELITYCIDNNYILENGLADLDLGYLYWKNILDNKKVA